MIPFPLFYSFFVLLSLQVVALVAQRLEVRFVIEPVGAYRPWFYVIHAGRGLYDAATFTLLTQGMICPERQAEPCPP